MSDICTDPDCVSQRERILSGRIVTREELDRELDHLLAEEPDYLSRKETVLVRLLRFFRGNR